MQDDLDRIYQWAEKNIMKFNEGKFEQMSWGKIKDIDVEAYYIYTFIMPRKTIKHNIYLSIVLSIHLQLN